MSVRWRKHITYSECSYANFHTWLLSLSVFPSRSLPHRSKTPSRWAWSWRRWTGRIPTSSVRPQWGRCVVLRCWSPSMAGGGPSTTTAATTHATSSPLAGAHSPETTSSRLVPKVWTETVGERFYEAGCQCVCSIKLQRPVGFFRSVFFALLIFIWSMMRCDPEKQFESVFHQYFNIPSLLLCLVFPHVLDCGPSEHL